jgi:Na+/proline symporter
MSPFEITVLITIIILVVYAVHGFLHYDRYSTSESFFLNNRNLSLSNIRNTFIGASISISTVLMFFLTIGINFGWYILISPVTLAIGVLVFSRYIYPALIKDKELHNALKGNSKINITSLTDLINYLYGSKLISIIVTTISAIGVLSILIAEMMVGVTIYEQYFLKPEYILLLIAITLFLYAGLGGMRSVVATDKWQIGFIIISLIGIISALILDLYVSPNTVAPILLDWSPKMNMPIALIANILIVNLCFLPSSIRVWQVVVASSKTKKFNKALWHSTIIILFITLSALFISKGVSIISGESNIALHSIFNYLVTNTKTWVKYIVYPLFIAGLLSALISTADSAILPLAQSLTGMRKQKFNILFNALIIFILLIIVIISYFIITRYFNMGVISWILTVFSISTGITPIIIIPLLFKQHNLQKTKKIIIAIGAILSFFIPLLWSIKFKDNFSIQPWNCVIGFSISMVLTSIAFYKEILNKLKTCVTKYTME